MKTRNVFLALLMLAAPHAQAWTDEDVTNYRTLAVAVGADYLQTRHVLAAQAEGTDSEINPYLRAHPSHLAGYMAGTVIVVGLIADALPPPARSTYLYIATVLHVSVVANNLTLGYKIAL